MHRSSILIIVQRDATQGNLFIILQIHSTCFGCQPRLSTGVHKTVTTASGTGHFLYSYLPPTWPSSLAALEGGSRTKKTWAVPEAVVTVLCTPDDNCGWHPKHVEWNCRIINRLLCVASRWTIINMDFNLSSTKLSVLNDSIITLLRKVPAGSSETSTITTRVTDGLNTVKYVLLQQTQKWLRLNQPTHVCSSVCVNTAIKVVPTETRTTGWGKGALLSHYKSLLPYDGKGALPSDYKRLLPYDGNL